MVRYKFSNSLTNSGMVIWGILVGFVMAPILLSRMQTYQYGFWEIVVTIVGYAGILDLGVKLAVTRFVSLYNESRSQSINVLMSTAFIFLTFLGFVFSLVCLFLSHLDIFTEHFSEVPNVTVRLSLILISAQILFAFPRYTIESYFQGCHRYGLINLINVVSGLFSIALILSFMDESNALILLPFINALINIVVFIFLWLKVSRFEKISLQLGARYFEYRELRKLISFGSKTFVQGIAARFNYTVGVLIVGYSFGPALVPVYSFPAQLFRYLFYIGSSLSQPLLPYFTQISLGEPSPLLSRQFVLFSAALSQVMIAGYVGTMFFGESFLALWIGTDIAQQARPLIYVFAIAAIMDTPNILSNWILTSMDKHGFLARIEIVRAIIRFSFAITLSYPFGLLGVAMGIALGQIVLSPVIFVFIAKQLGKAPLKLLWCILIPSLIPSFTMIVTIFVVQYFVETDSWLSLIVSISICGMAYVVTSYRSLAEFYAEQIRLPTSP